MKTAVRGLEWIVLEEEEGEMGDFREWECGLME